MQEDNTAIRRHVRHVTGIPIEITVDFDRSFRAENESVSNVSLGGLSFIASDRLDVGEAIQVKIPVLNEEHSLDGLVVWCNKTTQGYEVGLEFNDPDEVERLRMIEQISQIETFRRDLEKREGRTLNSEQAAREWVSKYAGEFSALT